MNGGLEFMSQEVLRKELNKVLDAGVSAKAISKVTGIYHIDISRFKNGQIMLMEEKAKRLERYLALVKLPTEAELELDPRDRHETDSSAGIIKR